MNPAKLLISLLFLATQSAIAFDSGIIKKIEKKGWKTFLSKKNFNSPIYVLEKEGDSDIMGFYSREYRLLKKDETFLSKSKSLCQGMNKLYKLKGGSAKWSHKKGLSSCIIEFYQGQTKTLQFQSPSLTQSRKSIQIEILTFNFEGNKKKKTKELEALLRGVLK